VVMCRRILASPIILFLLFLTGFAAAPLLPFTLQVYFSTPMFLGMVLTPLCFAWHDYACAACPRVRIRVCSWCGLVAVSLACVLLVVGQIRMGVAREQSFLASFSDWGFELIRWSCVLSVVGIASCAWRIANP
jgi:hypothetical protein